MNYFNGPTIVCRCGRVFFDGEDVWTHVREEFEHEQKLKDIGREMQQQIHSWS